jgi:hypothetical protein
MRHKVRAAAAAAAAAAARHGVRSFTIPTDPSTFGKMLDA